MTPDGVFLGTLVINYKAKNIKKKEEFVPFSTEISFSGVCPGER